MMLVVAAVTVDVLAAVVTSVVLAIVAVDESITTVTTT